MSHAENQLKKRLADISKTNAEDWFLVSRVRHGMQLVMSALGSGEVITQPFTCITTVNPILESDQMPIYCDISRDTLSIDPKLLADLLNKKTKAVVVQHTFGATGDVGAVRRVLDKARSDALVLEDSAHCLGMLAMDGDRPVADVSFHSFGAEKMLPSRFGGAVWINPHMKDSVLRLAMVSIFNQLPRMSAKSSMQVGLYPLLNGVFNRLPLAIAGSLRNAASGVEIFVRPIMPVEGRGKNFGRPEKLPDRIVQQLLGHMNEYERICEHRTKIAAIFASNLKLGTVPKAVAGSNLPYVRFPLILESPAEAERLFKKLAARHMQPGKWYRPLLFPGPEDLEVYKYNGKKCPVAEDVSGRIINLPTGLAVTAKKAKEIADEVNS